MKDSQKIIVDLTSISPIAFSLAKVGDAVEVKKKLPKTNEFRGEKIGAASVSYLIFKGITKIGMIPQDFVQAHGSILKKRGRISKLDPTNQAIQIIL